MQQLEQYKETGQVSSTMLGGVVPGGVGDDDLEEDEEEEEDEFSYPGGAMGQSSTAGMATMASAQQQQAFQGQQTGQNMVTTSAVQQGASQSGQQFSNGQC